MRMCEAVRNMGVRRLAKAMRCPYEWHRPLLGQKPSCSENNCNKCIELFDFGEDHRVGLKEVVSKMTALQMARALKCPFDWFEPLADADATCDRGEDCSKCIFQFLLERDSNEFNTK